MNTPLHSGLSSSLQGTLHSEPVFGFLPSDITGLKLWTRFNSGITETGLGVSQWDDVSGNGNHLLQATDGSRPPKQADGSILFDGVADFLKAATFTLAQPESTYLLVNPVSWTDGDRIFDGNTANTGGMLQSGVTPAILAWAGAAGATSTELVLGSYGAMANVFDHDNALNTLQINNNTPSTDISFGTNDMSGFTLGAIGGGAANWSNIQVKECIVYSGAHDLATRTQIINYLLSL